MNEETKYKIETEYAPIIEVRPNVSVVSPNYKAAVFGYSLATEEIERLKKLVKEAYNTFYMRGFPHNEPTWEQFCETNKL